MISSMPDLVTAMEVAYLMQYYICIHYQVVSLSCGVLRMRSIAYVRQDRPMTREGIALMAGFETAWNVITDVSFSQD